jgi:hypothetical protein
MLYMGRAGAQPGARARLVALSSPTAGVMVGTTAVVRGRGAQGAGVDINILGAGRASMGLAKAGGWGWAGIIAEAHGVGRARRGVGALLP